MCVSIKLCLEPRFFSRGSPFPVCSLDSDDQAKYKPSPRLSTRRTTCWSEITWTIHRGGRNLRHASSPVCHHRPNWYKSRKDSSRPTWSLGSWCSVAPWAQHGQYTGSDLHSTCNSTWGTYTRKRAARSRRLTFLKQKGGASSVPYCLW